MTIQSSGSLCALALLAAVVAAPARAQDESGKRLDVYGFAMLDMGYETGRSDPDWFDVLRPTKLPSWNRWTSCRGARMKSVWRVV